MVNVPLHVDHTAMNWTPERMLSRLDGDTELAFLTKKYGVF